jgi:hypothetical protein
MDSLVRGEMHATDRVKEEEGSCLNQLFLNILLIHMIKKYMSFAGVCFVNLEEALRFQVHFVYQKSVSCMPTFHNRVEQSYV